MARESEIIFYQTDDGNIKIEVFYQDETFWITQKKMSNLFGVQRPAITKHLKKIFEAGELIENSVSSIMEHTAEDGKNYKTTFYNLDVIIAVGYRVNSLQATKFRVWATKTLKEFIIKAEQEYDKYRKIQDKNYTSDFDNEIKRLKGEK